MAFSSSLGRRIPAIQWRHSNAGRCGFATGTRGSRGHGWYANYRAGKGGRHLQGEYFNHHLHPTNNTKDVDVDTELDSSESPAITAQTWNDAVLQLGSMHCYLDICLEPRRGSNTSSSSNQKPGRVVVVPPLEELHGDVVRLELEIASTVMPTTCQNFTDLLTSPSSSAFAIPIDDDTRSSTLPPGYLGTRLYRFEQNVGICGGDVLTNTGRTGRAFRGAPLHLYLDTTNNNAASMNTGNNNNNTNNGAASNIPDPLALWHLPGTVTMLVPTVGAIDSRFMICTQEAPHIDGMCRAFGRLSEASLRTAQQWQKSLLTRQGIPTAYDLIVVGGGVLTTATTATSTTEPAQKNRIDTGSNSSSETMTATTV